MPSTRHVSRETASPTEPSSAQQTFHFPVNRHLLITTPRHVFGWDATGVRTLFSSSRGSIVAAKEAKDGSGILAIASNNVVVMHDMRRGQEESWGLNAPQDHVRHLEYAPDAKTLYLTTAADGTVQQYSTERSRLLTPAQKHEDAPMALAVSPTGHLLLSASQTPPVVHLKNTAHNTVPIQLHPNASTAPVSFAAFHPERPDVFLLAFQDAVVAIYDASKLSRKDKDSYSTQQGTGDGELARIQITHRAIMTGDDGFNAPSLAPPIAGAAFLPGFKSRIVTAGRDGRCKIIDFSDGSEVLRTWHAKAPLTSVAILALKSDVDPRQKGKIVARDRRSRTAGSHAIGGPTSTNSIIAVSRVDGKILLFDSVGLLVAQTTVSSQEEKIIALEWSKGSSPRTSSRSTMARKFSDEVPIALSSMTVDQPPSLQSPATETYETAAEMHTASTTATASGLPSTLMAQPIQPTRKFTLHPDEVQESTVRFTPSPQKPQLGIPARAAYDDLFSPVKPPGQSKQQGFGPPPGRPRISSQTFVQASPGQGQTGLTTPDERQSRVLSPKTMASASAMAITLAQTDQSALSDSLKPAPRASMQISPTMKSRRRISFAHDGPTLSYNSARKQAKSNAQVLAEIRSLSSQESKQGTLSSYAASQRRCKNAQPRPVNQPRPVKRAVKCHVADSTTWPTDSASFSGEVSNNDIWLTSDGEDDVSLHKRRKTKPATRPPARQASRTKVNSGGTNSTTGQLVAQHNADGSTDEQMLSAAAHLSPASDHVRELFPRTSSLSPGKGRSRSKGRRLSPAKRYIVLSSMPPNVAMARTPKSPWDKLKASKATRPVHVFEDPAVNPGPLTQSDAASCRTCPDTKARVAGLETEVAHLKGEVLALKAILRRNGLPFPACLR